MTTRSRRHWFTVFLGAFVLYLLAIGTFITLMAGIGLASYAVARAWGDSPAVAVVITLISALAAAVQSTLVFLDNYSRRP
jgi:hypothetical protein